MLDMGGSDKPEHEINVVISGDKPSVASPIVTPNWDGRACVTSIKSDRVEPSVPEPTDKPNIEVLELSSLDCGKPSDVVP